TVAVGVIEELAGARVVNDAIVGIVAAGRTLCGIEARVAAGESAGRADAGEAGSVEPDTVPVGIEVEHRVGVRCAVLGEGVAVLAGAAGNRIVAGATLHPVV